MSSSYAIVCRSCGSYQIEPTGKPSMKATKYHCALCGEEFTVEDPAAYAQQHPPNPRRCSRCDKEAVELVERNHAYSNQPTGEIVDLYSCRSCGLKIHKIVQRSPHVWYH